MTVFRYLSVAGVLLSALLGAANASDSPATLIGKTVTIYDEARDLSGDDRIRELRKVDDLLSRIEREYP